MKQFVTRRKKHYCWMDRAIEAWSTRTLGGISRCDKRDMHEERKGEKKSSELQNLSTHAQRSVLFGLHHDSEKLPGMWLLFTIINDTSRLEEY
jgi:hypothetical protein